MAGPYVWGDSHPARVESLKVKEGDDVRRGQALAVFVGSADLEAEVAQAQAQTAKARLRVEQVKSGARKPDLAAQQAEVSRLEAESQHARTELSRYEALRATDDVTVAELDARRNAVQVSEFAVEAARHRWRACSNPRTPRFNGRGGSGGSASQRAASAQRIRGQRHVYARADGRVLKINTREGEEVGMSGLMDIARTETCSFSRKFIETDIGRVRVGRHATISGDILEPKLDRRGGADLA